MGRIWVLLRPRLGQMLLASLFMAVVAVSTAGYAYLVGPVIKSLFMTGPAEAVVEAKEGMGGLLQSFTAYLGTVSAFAIGTLVVVAAAVKGLAFFAQKMLVIHAGQQILLDLRARMFAGLLKMNPLGSQSRTAGEMVSRFTVDAETVQHAVTYGAMAYVSNGLQAVALVGLAVSLSPTLTLVGSIAFPPIAFLISRIGRMLRKLHGEYYDAYTGMTSSVEESREGLFVIQSFGAQEYAEERFDKQNRTLARKAVSAFRIGSISSPLNEVLGAGALGFTLWYAHMQIASEQLTAEAFISFFTALFLMYRPIKGFGQAVHAVQTGLAALDRLDRMTDPDDPFGTRGDGTGIQVEGLTAGYDEGEPIVHDITFSLAKGERLSVVGESGSGKTTLINVLGGYLKPFAGALESDWPVAVVTQDSFLFDDTIEMNVKCGRLDATPQEVKAACEDAGVMGFATDLGGLHYKVGPGGSALSAGQRQRICLARAVLSKAGVVLLDEVTASLDGKTETLLIDRLAERLTGRTVVIVTHRAATAKWAGRTLVLEEGRVVLDGPFEQLMDGNPRMRVLFGSKELS